MRFGSPEVAAVLREGSFDYRWEAELYYNGSQLLADVPVGDVRASEDGNAQVQQTVTLTVTWSDEFAQSIVPRAVGDDFAPFGAQLWLYTVVGAGEFAERVRYGQFEIVDVPSAWDEWMRFDTRWISTGSTVELVLKERLAVLGEESFDVPTPPSQLGSAWAEVGVVSGMPLRRSVPDVPISRSIMYPESRLRALYELVSVALDAVPHVTAEGALSARPNSWPDPVDVVRLRQLVSVGSAMSPVGVFNRVVVRASGGDPAVLAVAEVTSGPLRVRNADGSRSPFGTRTYYLSSEFVTTAAQAGPWAESTLARVSTLRTSVVPVVEVFNPLRERGDVVIIERPTEWLLGRVVTVNRSGATQDLTVEIKSSQPRFERVLPPWLLGGLIPDDDLFPADDLLPESGEIFGGYEPIEPVV